MSFCKLNSLKKMFTIKTNHLQHEMRFSHTTSGHLFLECYITQQWVLLTSSLNNLLRRKQEGVSEVASETQPSATSVYGCLFRDLLFLSTQSCTTKIQSYQHSCISEYHIFHHLYLSESGYLSHESTGSLSEHTWTPIHKCLSHYLIYERKWEKGTCLSLQ